MTLERNLQDFKDIIKELEKCELDAPRIDEVQETLNLVTDLINEFEGYLCDSVEEAINKINELEDRVDDLERETNEKH